MKHTTNDALRMAGQLLLHHPTIGYLARDKFGNETNPYGDQACSWCFMGAIWAADSLLKTQGPDIFKRAAEVTGVDHYDQWDRAPESARCEIATKLANIVEP